MTKRKPLLLSLLLLAAALLLVFRLTHPTRWSADLLTYLENAETVTGEVILRDRASVPLSAEQVSRVLSTIRNAKLSDNREFAGTTCSGWIQLNADGEKVHICCLEDTEIQYHCSSESRSVRAAPSGYTQPLREIMQEALHDKESAARD